VNVVTARPGAHTIGYVSEPSQDAYRRARSPGQHRGRSGGRSPDQHRGRQWLRQPALTKRRAVDFCRVATALCPAGSARYAGCTVSVCV
jgi:hypothetical protein